MAIDELQISLDAFEFEAVKADLKKYVIQRFPIYSGCNEVRIQRKSLDARSRNIMVHLRLKIYSGDAYAPEPRLPEYPPSTSDKRVFVVGFGPAGIFACFKFLEFGIRPVVLERGKAISGRRRDVAKLNRGEKFDPESNYCFGEGGAGTFSDGKLYTRSTKRGPLNEVLENFVFHGADQNILYEAQPHIGTNKLPEIIRRMRQTLVEHGVEVRFSARMTDIEIKDHRITGIAVNGKLEDCDRIILATGHSARDVFELLHEKNVAMEAKPFAMGFRMEHPQELINNIQYHKHKRRNVLPPANYRLVEQIKGKGVFSFCMCPGGIIAPAQTAEGEKVVNGWSPSKRNGAYANSGWVTEIDEKDWKPFEHEGALAGLAFQKMIEKKAHEMAGGGQRVPAQNLKDYLEGRVSRKLNPCSYHPGLSSVDLNDLYPVEVNARLKEGLLLVTKKLKGFLSDQAIITAPESRTSSPVRIPRNEHFQHPDIKDLYPCGEGAGYAGGIVSAAIDGMNAARMCAMDLV